MKVFLRAEDREYSDIATGVRSEDVALLYERGGFGVADQYVHETKTIFTLLLLALVFVLAAGCESEGSADPCTGFGSGGEVTACEANAAPTLLDEEVATPFLSTYASWPLAQDEAHIYWASAEGDVMATPKEGGQRKVVQPASGCTVTGIAVDDNRVYWLRSCATTTGIEATLLAGDKFGGNAEELLMEDWTSGSLVLSSGWLLWTSHRGEASSHLWSYDLESGIAQVIAEGSGPYFPFAVTSAGVYHRIRLGGDTPSDLVRQQPDGSDDRVIASIAAVVETMLVGDGVLHWIEAERKEQGTERSLWRLAAAEGSQPERVVPGRVTSLVAVEGADVYGVGHLEDEGVIALRLYWWRAPDFEPVPLADPIRWPQAIAVDAEHVYWLDSQQPAAETVRLMRIDR
jgi:hypothetical protein